MQTSKSLNILILSVQVPFTRGGAEILVDGLRREIASRGHTVDLVQLPFNADPKEVLLRQGALWRALDLSSFNGKKVDLVIATKFPSYLVKHPNKVLWLVHQHRQIYELYGSRFGDFNGTLNDEALREMLVNADKVSLNECRSIFCISPNVAERLGRFLDIEGGVLTPPLPLGNRYRSESVGDYILSVGRICSIKRVDLIIKALPLINDQIKLKVVGLADEPGIELYLRNEIEKHHLWNRVEFLGRVEDEQLLTLYANAFGVYYAPFDEDYGFVTLEALASSRPVVTASDSGGVLSFIRNEENGLVAEPNEKSIAAAFNRLYDDSELYQKLAEYCPKSIVTNSWDEIIAALCGEQKDLSNFQQTAVTELPTSAEFPTKIIELNVQKINTSEVFFSRELE